MCWLMFMGRGVTQAVRVVLGALMPFIAADLELDHQEKGTVFAAFAAGYMCAQVLGAGPRTGTAGGVPFYCAWIFRNGCVLHPWSAISLAPTGYQLVYL